MNRIDPSDLAGFLAIAKHRSFRQAADERGCTPSALSHSLRLLEERLGVRLVNRTTRSVALTEAGRRLQARVAPAFRDIADAIDDLNMFRDSPAGTLRLNTANAAVQIVVLPFVARFLDAYPGVNVEIDIDSALIDIVAKGYDAGIRFGETLAQDMIAMPLGPRQRAAVVASPEFFNRHPKPKTPADLKSLPCVRFRLGSGRVYSWEFERGGKETKVEVEGRLTLDELSLCVQAAVEGVGITYAFEAQVAEHLAAGRLVRVLEDWCPEFPGFYLYYPSRRQLPAALRAFVEFAKSA